MSAASIAAEVEGVGGQPASAQTICRTLHQIGLHGCHPRRKPTDDAQESPQTVCCLSLYFTLYIFLSFINNINNNINN